EAEADVVLLLAEGYRCGPTDHAVVRQARNTQDLPALAAGFRWSPPDPAGKWTSSLVTSNSSKHLERMADRGAFTVLNSWGATRLGMVTGGNRYFTLSPDEAQRLNLPRRELIKLSPPGSSH